MGRKILIDTNNAIGFIGNSFSIQTMDKLDGLFNSHYHISFINKIELLGLGILTLNTKDFENIDGLKIIEPESI